MWVTGLGRALCVFEFYAAGLLQTPSARDQTARETNRRIMKLGYTKLVVTAAIVVLVLIVGGPTASAQSCPSSPNYLPDFTANQNCLTLNGINYDTPSSLYPGFYPAVPTPPPGVTNVLRLTPNQQAWAGAAWYNTQQPVSGPFSSTFTFQLTGANGVSCGDVPCPGDGIAFVIQNSATSALGPEGCGIGFGSSAFCQAPYGPQTGIPNSLAIEFNTFFNYGVDPSDSSVVVQNCGGTGANSVDPSCRLAVNDLTQLANPIIWRTVRSTLRPSPTRVREPNCWTSSSTTSIYSLPTPSNPAVGGIRHDDDWFDQWQTPGSGSLGATYGADDNQDIQTGHSSRDLRPL